MRITIEVRNGSERQRRSLRAGQRLTIGRSEHSDWTFPKDARMSKRHFEIAVTDSECSLADLGSANGTILNDTAVAKGQLCHGDSVLAGQTEFAVKFLGHAGELMLTPSVPVPERAVVQPLAVKPGVGTRRSGGGSVCIRETCESSLTKYRSEFETGTPAIPSAAQMVQSLAESVSVHVVLNMPALPDDVVIDESQGVALFDWIPPEFAKEQGAVLFSYNAIPDVSAVISQLWDQNAVVVVLSDLPTEDLASHFQRAFRFDVNGSVSENPQGILGINWPTVVCQLLEFRTPEFIGQFFNGIRAIMVELPDLPDNWQIFGRPEFSGSLTMAGVTIRE